MQRHVYSKVDSLDSPCVLFQDYNGFWAPLNDLYFSTSSKVLVSRHPESAIEEVVSHYCPQCVNMYSENGVNTYANRCATCMQCPCCQALVTGMPIKHEGLDKCCLVCSVCSWSSLACGIIGDREEDLAAVLLAKESSSKSSEAFATILASLTTAGVQNLDPSTTPLKTTQHHDTWGIQELDKLQEKKAAQGCSDPQREGSLYKYLHDDSSSSSRFKVATERRNQDTQHFLSCTDASSLSTFQQRLQGEYVSCPSLGAVHEQLLPQRIYLRSKKMLRCRRDVKAGKMSILVQPKTVPLEGDSSLKLQQGKWFLKDASACHHIPRVVITKLPVFAKDDDDHGDDDGESKHPGERRVGYLHVEISNSRDSDVVVLLATAVGTGASAGSSAGSGAGVAKEEGVTLEDISLCDEKSNSNSSSNGSSSCSAGGEVGEEQHPPFSAQLALCSLRVAAAPPPPLLLRGYEDELLREVSDFPEVADFAPEGARGGAKEWGVLLDQHVAKLCIPVSFSCKSGDEAGSSRFVEVKLSMSVSERAGAGAGPGLGPGPGSEDSAAGGAASGSALPAVALAEDSCVRVELRVAFSL